MANKLFKAVSLVIFTMLGSLLYQECTISMDILNEKTQQYIQGKFYKMQEKLEKSYPDEPWTLQRTDKTEGILQAFFVNMQYDICHTSKLGSMRYVSEGAIGRATLSIPEGIGFMFIKFLTYEEIETNKKLIIDINKLIEQNNKGDWWFKMN